MKKQTKLTFEEWFKLQHGDRPSTKDLCYLAEDYKSDAVQASRSFDLYNKCKEWDYKHTSALYAYSAQNTMQTMRRNFKGDIQ